MITKTLLTTAILAMAATVATPSFARGTCKDAYVVATNDTGHKVKVVDMHYQISGYGKKSEPIRNQDIPAGQVFSITRNLERANERNTQVIVVYRVRTDNAHFNKWSGLKRATSDFQECTRNHVYEVSLTD
ncbi:hypothetical protein [Primorskyibacter sp. 2E233]|uniref:hypothetical protein n=1 Tax=Primorskyibacter sp. 2E233 TaxID=3413431 RepID=UPI003BF3D752